MNLLGSCGGSNYNYERTWGNGAAGTFYIYFPKLAIGWSVTVTFDSPVYDLQVTMFGTSKENNSYPG